jgi:5'-nucleotidase
MNNGGIRSDLRAGPATYGTLFEVQPFGNVLYRVTASGAAMRRYFEALGRGDGPDEHVSGVVATYDLSRPEGSRLVSLVLPSGRPVDDTATYTIALNDFMVTGARGEALQHDARSTVDLKIVDLDALVGYLRAQNGPVQPPAGGRIVITGK